MKDYYNVCSVEAYGVLRSHEDGYLKMNIRLGADQRESGSQGIQSKEDTVQHVELGRDGALVMYSGKDYWKQVITGA